MTRDNEFAFEPKPGRINARNGRARSNYLRQIRRHNPCALFARRTLAMSISRSFTCCMIGAALIIVLVAGRTVLHDAADYRAHTRAIDAELSLEASLRAMERLALERGPTFSLLTSAAAADATDRRPMDAARAATAEAVAEIRRRIAALSDTEETPAIGRVAVLARALDALDAARLASHRVLDDGLARPLSDRNPGLTQAHATAELTLHRRFVPLLNGLQARLAASAADAASVVQIARYAADLRELAGLQASLVT
jgi:hypothetical protein